MLNAPTPRLLLSCGFAVAALAMPITAIATGPAPAVPQAACPAGEENDVFSGDCQTFLSPNTHTVNGPDYSGNFSEHLSTVNGANPDIPEIDGIPCTGDNAGECIGLSEDQTPEAVPHSTFGTNR